MWIVLSVAIGLLFAIGLAVVLILITHVEDWGRDLSINHAATSDDATDERLRTLEVPLGPGDLAALVTKSAQSLPRWALVEQAQTGDTIQLHFVRTTGLVGYKDDIRVRIEPAGEGSRLSAESRSRIGKGDLGQNPRNLRELLGPLRASLPSSVCSRG
jgi:uncharacterized protein (DUF1499 family)